MRVLVDESDLPHPERQNYCWTERNLPSFGLGVHTVTAQSLHSRYRRRRSWELRPSQTAKNIGTNSNGGRKTPHLINWQWWT